MAFFRGCSDVTNMSKHVECELKDMEHQMNKVVYICFSLLHLAVESCDLSQVEEKITVVTS